MDASKRKELLKTSFRQALSSSSSIASLSSRHVAKRASSKVNLGPEGPVRKSIKLMVSKQGEKSKPVPPNPVKLLAEDVDMEQDEDEDNNVCDEEEKRIVNRAIKTDFGRLFVSRGKGEEMIKDVDKINAKVTSTGNTATTESRTDPDGESDGREDTMMPTPTELPKGFFDDPKVDAKVRKLTYRDPIDEQMDLFKRAIAVETYKAETEGVVETDSLEDIQVDRDFEEIEAQIVEWAKVNELQVQAERLKVKLASEAKNYHDSDEDENDLDLSEINVFSKWRAKSIEQQSR